MDARSLAWVFAAAALWGATPQTACALSCDGHLVELGASEAYVRTYCGEATLATTREELRSTLVAAPVYGLAVGYATTVPVRIDVLVYDFGPTRFVEELTFVNGYLRAERLAGYGTVAAAHARREARRIERTARRRDDE